MRSILVQVWQGKLTPGLALNKLEDEFIKDRPKFKKLRKNRDRVLYALKTLGEKAITTTECEEEIIWALKNCRKCQT